MKRYRGNYASFTDRGRVRISNEDQAGVATNEKGDVLLVVCDGMGGQNKGDYASKMALDTLLEAFEARSSILFPQRFLLRAVKEANKRIFSMAETNPAYEKMGTTLVAALIIKDKVYVVNVGDSRCYSYSRMLGLTRLTHDQTYVDYLVRAGKISKEETYTHPERHVLMNALGTYPSASMDIFRYQYHGESILLCSDGLYNNLSETEIRAVLGSDERPEKKARALIIDANGNGGSDNIAVAYWEVSHD
ncbi:MAG: Stp1/IreP family PP2C-type Ser/Thr phosphatase [Candidatus Enteromonas sp.]|nr:Stp1/IreP family PP2C-type Ser/Thr phosphatase [Candidatus Enteromonas sp.]